MPTQPITTPFNDLFRKIADLSLLRHPIEFKARTGILTSFPSTSFPVTIKGGLISQLIDGTIQRKINESAQKEQELFDSGKEVLLGTNKYPNKNDQMKNDLELYPFVKQNARKTLITPIIEKRLAEKLEQERLSQEQ